MTVIGALSSFRELGEMSPHKRAPRKVARLVPGMYGPPHDCKGKLRGEKTSLRKCIRPLMEINSPGHDELRACLSL